MKKIALIESIGASPATLSANQLGSFAMDGIKGRMTFKGIDRNLKCIKQPYGRV